MDAEGVTAGRGRPAPGAGRAPPRQRRGRGRSGGGYPRAAPTRREGQRSGAAAPRLWGKAAQKGERRVGRVGGSAANGGQGKAAAKGEAAGGKARPRNGGLSEVGYTMASLDSRCFSSPRQLKIQHPFLLCVLCALCGNFSLLPFASFVVGSGGSIPVASARRPYLVDPVEQMRSQCPPPIPFTTENTKSTKIDPKHPPGSK